MIADPLLEPSVKLIVAVVSPGAMDMIVGAAGAVGSGADVETGVTDVLDDAAPAPVLLTAFSFTW